MKMMVNYSLLPLLLASPYKNRCSHSNQRLHTQVGQLDSVSWHRWLVAAPPFLVAFLPHTTCTRTPEEPKRSCYVPTLGTYDTSATTTWLSNATK